MANFLRISLLGVDALLKQIGTRAGATIAKSVNDQMLALAVEITEKAKSRCPRDTGELASSITFTRTPIPVGKMLIWKVGTNLWYAPFVEFGTGRRGAASSGLVSRVPQAEQTRQAMQYVWGAGSEKPYIGADGVTPGRTRAIEYKGPRADPEQGMPARPFLFPAYFEAITTFASKIKHTLESEFSKKPG